MPHLLNHYTFQLTAVSTDADYGYSIDHPIPVAGSDPNHGPLNERRLLNALLTADGKPVYYERIYSTSAYNPDDSLEMVIIDVYALEWESLEEPVLLYLNMYAKGEMKAPAGFSYRTLNINDIDLQALADLDDFDIDALDIEL